MKRKYYKIVSLLIFILLVFKFASAQRLFIAGGEFQFVRLSDIEKSKYGKPDTVPDTILVKLTLYRDCKSIWTIPPDPTQKFQIVRFSNQCCEYAIDTVSLNQTYSNKHSTPICPTSSDFTQCASQTSSYSGYQTEVYTAVVVLKCRADDWKFAFLYSKDMGYGNCYPYLGPYNSLGLGSANQQINRIPNWPGAPYPPAPNPAQLPWRGNSPAINTSPSQQQPDQAFFYLEATYSNNIVLGFTNTNPPTAKTMANTSPESVASPLIFQCLNVQRTYDLGYYDADGHFMTFEPTPVFKDVSMSGTSNNLTAVGLPIDYQNGMSYLQPFGTASGSFYSINKNTGEITFSCNNDQIGKYKTAVKIKEYLEDPTVNPGAQQIGETTRDVVITILNDEQCKDADYIANSSIFINNSISNTINCGIAPNRANTVEACAGSKIQFNFSAYSTSTNNNASILFNVERHPAINKDSSRLLAVDYHNNTYPLYDTAIGGFSWNIPDTIKPGLYWVKFQINSCIGPYILSPSYIVYIRINDNTKITSGFYGFSPSTNNTVTFPTSDTVTYCDSKMKLSLTANNGIADALFDWYPITSGITSNPISQNGNDNKFNLPDILNFTDLGVEKIRVVSNQYCNNSDTITIVNHTSYTPTLTSYFKDLCLNTVGLLTIGNLPKNFEIDWTAGSGIFKTVPNIYSNIAFPVIKKINNDYNPYVYFTDYNCPFSLSTSLIAEGIKPKGDFTTDKSYVCPLDTIKAIQLKMTTAICGGKTNYSQIKPGILTSQFNSTKTNVNAVPKIFTATPDINQMRTQVLYRASDLRKNGFKAGVIDKIGFNLLGVTSPLFYNNVKVRVTCTDRTDLQNLNFEDTSTMLLIADLPSIYLNIGWNMIPLGTQFTWDDSTNLIFDFSSSCNFPEPGSTSTPPAYMDRITNYVSIIGKYGLGLEGFNKSSVFSSTYSPDIRFDYYELADTIHYVWKDISTNTANTTVITDTSKEPRFVSYTPRLFQVEFSNGKCKEYDTIPIIYDTTFKIELKNSSTLKCPGDTIQVNATYYIPPIRPLVLTCGTNNKPEDSCRVYDKRYNPFIGNPLTTVGNANISPFGGSGGLGSLVTDKRLQFILPYRELLNTPGMNAGYIDSITFIVSNFFANSATLNDFTIKLKCIPPNMEFFTSNQFETVGSFEEVFFTSNYAPVAGDNTFPLNQKFAWDGKTGIMVDVCFDNPTGLSYGSTFVKGSALKDSSTLYFSTNSGDTVVGCDFEKGSKTVFRPDIKLKICAATRPMPPIPMITAWAPTTYINNTKIVNPIVYNINTTDYYVIERYVDTNYNQNKVVCIVRDTFYSKVNRPLAEFNNPIACAGDSAVTLVGIKDTAADRLYTYIWDTTQIGIDKAKYINPKQNIFPNNPGFYRVYFYETAKPNCYNLDSVFVNIQNRSIMPNIGGPSQLCVGDTILLDIPTNLGYKKTVWLNNNNFVDTGYVIAVSDTGTFVVYVDSGVCRNYSNQKVVSFRPVDTTRIHIPSVTICQGDTAVLYYNLNAGISNPVWNTGSTSLVLKVTQPGIYYLVNPRTQYGCLFKTNDTGKVELVNNPDFKLNSDTLCLSANGKVVLQPTPYDADAIYTWQPVNFTGSSYEASLPGTYTVTRAKGNCKKTAQTQVVNDTPGTLNLGPNMAICCDEVLTLNANPQNLQKYKSYKWSTDERSQFIFTKPNSSGKYIVEAFKPNGCRDTGSIFIKSLCANVEAKPERTKIQLGETNPIIATFDTIANAAYIYEWKSPDAINQVVNGTLLNPITKPGDTGDVEYVLTMQIKDTSFMPPKGNCIENTVVRYRVNANSFELIDWFSPNQDNDRDVFWPDIKGNVKITDFKVYNRFGQMIHNETIPWDGKFKGEPQPIGAYVGLISYELNAPRKPGQVVHKQISISLFR